MNHSQNTFLFITLIFITTFLGYYDTRAQWEIKDSITIILREDDKGNVDYAYFERIGFVVNLKKEILLICNIRQFGVPISSSIVSSPIIYKSIDTGNTYKIVYPIEITNKRTFTISSITSIDNENIVLYNDTIIFRTSNYGDSWQLQQIKLPSGHNLKQLLLNKTNDGLAISKYNTSYYLFVTYDGGLNWKNFQNNPEYVYDNHYLEILYFYKNNIILLENIFTNSPYTDSYLHITTDFGKNWKTIKGLNGFGYTGKYHFLDSLTGFFLVNEMVSKNEYPHLYIYKTDDCGLNWKKVYDEIDPFLDRQIQFSGSYILLRNSNQFWLSKDKGETFKLDSTLMRTKDMNFISPGCFAFVYTEPLELVGFAQDYSFFEDKPLFYFTKYKQTSSSKKNEDDNLNLFFPNPATEKLTLINIPDNATEFEIYDQFGNRQISGLISGQIDVSLLPEGVYFIKLNNSQRPLKFLKI